MRLKSWQVSYAGAYLGGMTKPLELGADCRYVSGNEKCGFILFSSKIAFFLSNKRNILKLIGRGREG